MNNLGSMLRLLPLGLSRGPTGSLTSACQCFGSWNVGKIRWERVANYLASRQQVENSDIQTWTWLIYDATRFSFSFPTSHRAQGAAGSHLNLWCLLQWDIVGLKQGTGVGQSLKTCIHSKHESASNQSTEGDKRDFQRNTFILPIVSSWNGSSSQPMWTLDTSFKGRAAYVASDIAPMKKSL